MSQCSVVKHTHLGVYGVMMRQNDMPNDHELRVGGDGQDSLGAYWIAIEDLPKHKVTPFISLLFELDSEI